ncbi:hypothetical protein [[Mycobacterium] burgundiense]|uniref:DUF559 domain-containing protein n=1 Tax=[Mycobacterium] burgundiense TaxID=3064286 RepID=A0ABM9LAG2_9MYCO|nr:hypothetical protein [Mycolicibacterium sp. MU0053]CAJ1495718.1 hypothetical protein MU0053_000467 [Mycolicibacterium sp. MU0053]
MRDCDWPFLSAEALADGGLSFRELRKFHAAAAPGVWVPRGVELSAKQQATAAWLWSRRQAVLAGLSASAMLGTKWVEAGNPAELIHSNRRPPAGIIVHSDTLAPGETELVDGMATTTAARTAFDLGRRLELDPGVQRIDALMNATHLKVAAVEDVIAAHPGARGLRQLRKTLALVNGGAESPYESLTRLRLVQAGFPSPETQIEIHDEYGRVFARLDMGWRAHRVGVDFDGAQHWTDSRRRNWDVERYARLPEFGWIDIRVTAGLLHNRPQVLFDRVGAALIARGCPKTW